MGDSRIEQERSSVEWNQLYTDKCDSRQNWHSEGRNGITSLRFPPCWFASRMQCGVAKFKMLGSRDLNIQGFETINFWP